MTRNYILVKYWRTVLMIRLDNDNEGKTKLCTLLQNMLYLQNSHCNLTQTHAAFLTLTIEPPAAAYLLNAGSLSYRAVGTSC